MRQTTWAQRRQLALLTASAALFILLSGCSSSPSTPDHVSFSPSGHTIAHHQDFTQSRGITIYKGFRPVAGLTEGEKGALYYVNSNASFIRGNSIFATSEDFSNTHLLALVNFKPYPAIVAQNQSECRYEHVDFSPKRLTRYEIPIAIPRDALHQGTNCLVFVATEDPHQRIKDQAQTILVGLRVDIVVGDPSSEGCLWAVNDHPDIEQRIGPRTVGSLIAATSVAKEGVRVEYEVLKKDLPGGRLYTRLASEAQQKAAVLLLANGALASYNGELLTELVEIPEQSQEVIVSAPVPDLHGNAAAMAFMVIPHVDTNLGAIDPSEGQPRGWNQVVVKP